MLNKPETARLRIKSIKILFTFQRFFDKGFYSPFQLLKKACIQGTDILSICSHRYYNLFGMKVFQSRTPRHFPIIANILSSQKLFQNMTMFTQNHPKRSMVNSHFCLPAHHSRASRALLNTLTSQPKKKLQHDTRACKLYLIFALQPNFHQKSNLHVGRKIKNSR